MLSAGQSTTRPVSINVPEGYEIAAVKSFNTGGDVIAVTRVVIEEDHVTIGMVNPTGDGIWAEASVTVILKRV